MAFDRCIGPIVLAAAAMIVGACAPEGIDGDPTSADESLRVTSFQNPLLGDGAGHFAYCGAPDVRKVGDTYVLVCASAGVGGAPDAYHVRTSRDLVRWSAPHTIFTPDHHPRWALPPAHGGMYWCPEIYYVDGRWLLLFAASKPNEDGSGSSMAIGQATADTLDGTWTAPDEPLVARGDHSQSEPQDGWAGRYDPTLLVDPETHRIYRDAAGDMFMYYISMNHVRVVRVHSDGDAHLNVVPETNHAVMLESGRPFGVTFDWEHGVLEAVEAQMHDGKVYLLFSGASAWDATYALGVARAEAPDGPFLEHGAPILSTAEGGQLVGPGHSSQWVEGTDGKLYLPYRVQRRNETGRGGTQLLALDRVRFDSEGWPRIGDGHPTEDRQAAP